MRKGDHFSNQLVIILMLDIIFELDSTLVQRSGKKIYDFPEIVLSRKVAGLGRSVVPLPPPDNNIIYYILYYIT